ncbi:hypothetical protein S40293_01005 [Stachybotrys chartarum IBT 40293]|nr:hypothetical protein S40293_01005 [Stachybotrys chartarum IBT 40293]
MPPSSEARRMRTGQAWMSILHLMLVLPFAGADCQCGYSIKNDGGDGRRLLFMDLLESDFTETEDISLDTDWVRQSFNVSAEAGRGEFGKAFLPDNIKIHRTEDDDTGLGLRVARGTDSEFVPVAEIDTSRVDLLWGSYRAGMKLSGVEGTCAAFFWEIDIEFLSREFDHDSSIYPIHLVIQSRQSAMAGFDAQATGTYKRVNLRFDPTAGFHEYRFDTVPGHVTFYADSEKIAEMQGAAVPSSAGHLILQHWSNGNPLWSGGPPAEDALLTVSYVKAYFNSSDDGRRTDLAGRCAAVDEDGGPCDVPGATAANASTGGWFMSRDGDPSQGRTDTDGDGSSEEDSERGGVGGDIGADPRPCFARLMKAKKGRITVSISSWPGSQETGPLRRHPNLLAASAVMATFNVVIQNNTKASALYTHLTGRDDEGLVMLKADGKTLYRPTSPSETLRPVQEDCGINVGGPGEQRTLTVPHVFGARIWFCKDKPLTFLLNPGPALVEPSVTNPSDPNYELDWSFCEFTFNPAELYANVSYVDFVSTPIALRLETASGEVKTVPGLPENALETIAEKLEEQGKRDGAGWERLLVRSRDGKRLLRVLSPNSGAVLSQGLFKDYYQAYVNAVWDKYRKEDLVVNSQFKWGDVKGRVNKDGELVFKGVGKFSKPSAADIFSCSTGPFAPGPDVSEHMLNIGARLAAALNRSTLLDNKEQPEGECVENYYCGGTTNHYSRVCHETSIEGRGYAFPYDDVGSCKGTDQSGFVNDPQPKVLTISVGAPL